MPKSYLTLLILLIAALIITPFGDAEAKRLGGGRSFGSKPSYSSPYQRSQIQPRRATIPAKAAPTRQADHQALPNRTGLLGWLAPLLAGGLLGSLLLGGAFEHLNLADLLVFGSLAFLLFKLLAHRSRPVEEAPYYSAGVTTSGAKESATRPFDTDLLFNRSNPNQASSALADTPADFDLEGFLEQAKKIFRQLQAAWSQGELADIRGLTTDEAFMEIKTQKETDGVGSVEVLALEAQLLDYQETSDAQTAAVLFTALIREDQQDPEQIEEIWHFVRAKFGFNSSWRLDGIQQIEG
ncbi:MAG: Tim44 domain-containing protein [Methylohalobius sp.]